MDVDISRIQVLIRTLDQHTGDPNVADGILDICKTNRSGLAPPTQRISAFTEAAFVRHACDALADITFGIRAGLEFSDSSSITAYISKYSRDLRQVMENTVRFHQIIDPAISGQLRISGNAAMFELQWKDPSFSRYHRRTEFLMGCIIARMRALTQTRLYPLEVRLQHEIGRPTLDYEKVAGFPITFGAERMEVLLPLSALDLPIPTYDPSLRAHLVEYGERLLAERTAQKEKTRARVEGLITRSLPGRVIHADEAADQLGLSPRTLSRRLSEEGTTYREIVEDLRCDLAQTFLKNGMTLSEISFSLGYGDQAAFSTAFKRWTGQAPSMFRDRVEHPISPN